MTEEKTTERLLCEKIAETVRFHKDGGELAWGLIVEAVEEWRRTHGMRWYNRGHHVWLNDECYLSAKTQQGAEWIVFKLNHSDSMSTLTREVRGLLDALSPMSLPEDVVIRCRGIQEIVKPKP